MISSIVWVPAGVADPNPKRYEMSAKELELLRLMEEQEQQNTSDKTKKIRGGLQVKPSESPAASLPADLRMDEYSSDEDEGKELARIIGMQSGVLPPDDEEDDQDEDHDEGENRGNADMDSESDDDSDASDDLADVPDTREFEPVDVEGLQAMGLNQIGNSAMHMDGLGEEDDDASEAENVRIADTDAIVLVAKTDEDFSGIEVHVYDERTSNLYVHHDIPLPSYPLCVAHGRVSSGGALGNFCAVGTFGPGIEIWNLDVLNALEPVCVLGGEDTNDVDEMLKMQVLGRTMPPPRGNEGVSLRPGSHTDAVMSLSWNPIHQQVIASGSADKTVKLWDITKAESEPDKCNAGTFTHHRDKVNAVEWHPKEGTLLATGSFDRSIVLLDARTSGENVKRVKIPSDCEALAWDPFHPEYLTVATEDGTLFCWDVRKFETSSPSWSVSSSEFGGLNDLSYNPNVPGMLATCSIDNTVTLWDTYKDNTFAPNASPRPCMKKDMAGGKLYTVKFYPSSPWLLGCGGSGKQLSLWHTDSEERVMKVFGGRNGADVEGVLHEAEPAKEDFEAMMAEKEGSRPINATAKTKKKRASKKKAHKRR